MTRNIVRKGKTVSQILDDVGFCGRVADALRSCPTSYMLRDGAIVSGRSISDLKRDLSPFRKGLDADAFAALGYQVLEGMYVGGMRPSGKMVKIITVPQREPTIEERGLAALASLENDPVLGPMARELKSLTDKIGKR